MGVSHSCISKRGNNMICELFYFWVVFYSFECVWLFWKDHEKISVTNALIQMYVEMNQKKRWCFKGKKKSLTFIASCIIPISFYLKLSPYSGCRFYSIYLNTFWWWITCHLTFPFYIMLQQSDWLAVRSRMLQLENNRSRSLLFFLLPVEVKVFLP